MCYLKEYKIVYLFNEYIKHMGNIHYINIHFINLIFLLDYLVLLQQLFNSTVSIHLL